METAIGELLQLSLRHADDLPGFYTAMRDWFSRNIDHESLIFYQPDPLENLPFKENHNAEPYVLHGQAHPPGDMEVSALQFRSQGICHDDSFLIHFQTEDTWYGALEGSGEVPEILSDSGTSLAELFNVTASVTGYALRAEMNDHLLSMFSLLGESQQAAEKYKKMIEIVAEATGCEELAYYRQRENHYELRTSIGFDPDELVTRQFYPREQLRQLGMDDKFYALEPSENSKKTDLFLPLTFADTRKGLIVAYETPYTLDNLTGMDKLNFKLINVLSTMTASLIDSQFDQPHEEVWDRVTNLRTESFFLARLEQEVERGDRYGYSFSLLLFEIQNLDDIREDFGETTLKELIRKLSHLVKTTFRIIDTACRFDNNQFGVLFPNTEREGAIRAGERLIALVEDPFLTIGDREISVRLDGGVAKYPEDGGNPDELLKQARLALYEAKQHESSQLTVSQDVTDD